MQLLPESFEFNKLFFQIQKALQYYPMDIIYLYLISW